MSATPSLQSYLDAVARGPSAAPSPAPQMRPPPPPLQSYLGALQQQQHPQGKQQAVIQGAVNKMKELQAKKAELQNALSQIELQIVKTQGALEVLQTMSA